MEREELEKIFEKTESKWNGDNAFQGLMIIRKYIPESKDVLCAAEHDVIYSVEIDEILEGGITEDDAKALAKLNWMLDEDNDCLSCFV